ncbi:hypothetical protein ACJ41O_014628 [Fusarium nematophilum]
MADHSICPLLKLPDEILTAIISFVPRPTLLRLRLINRRLGVIATTWLFRSIRLGSRLRKNSDFDCFFIVAQMEDCTLTNATRPLELGPLRHLVREATLDTWLGPDFEYARNNPYPLPEDFMNVLPLLRRFRNLSAVHIRFNEFCGNFPMVGVEADERTDFRYRVLDTAFRCMAGTWKVQEQERIDQELNLFYDYDYGISEYYEELSTGLPLPMKRLTVSNLGDYADERLTNSEAFRTVLSLPSLVDLRLLITTQPDILSPENAVWFTEKYDFFETLPQTWLQPSVATNLRTLSLFCSTCWGWSPKMDFRLVNPSEGGFPNLKVLALGNYIFSHEWQIDWIASQGKKTAAGGLEELYLDHCFVMFHAHHLIPLDESTVIVGRDPDGNDIEVSNKGYQRKDLIFEVDENDPPLAETPYPLRWHTILSRWRESMAALKVFRMGRGSWFGAPQVVIDIHKQDGSIHVREDKEQFQPYRNLEENVFGCFDCPPGSVAIDEGASNFPEMEKYRHGVGLNEDPRHQLLYAFCDMDFGLSEWVDINDAERYSGSDEWPQLEDGTKAKDEVALELFVSTVNSR